MSVTSEFRMPQESPVIRGLRDLDGIYKAAEKAGLRWRLMNDPEQLEWARGLPK